MTFSQGFKRLGVPIAALLVAIVVALGSASMVLDRDSMRASVEAQMRSATGLDLNVRGETKLSLLPIPSVTFDRVLLGSGEEPALSVDEVIANLRLIPLLLQRFEIADLVLNRPRIVVTRDADGRTNWTPLMDRLADRLKPGAAKVRGGVSDIGIKGGVLIYRDGATALAETFTGIDVSLAWPSISRSFAATGDFTWRGETIDGSINIADVAAALAGERSGIRARIAAAPLKLAFDGQISGRDTIRTEGTLSADSTSLRDVLRWSGHELPPGGGFGRFSLKARASMVNTSVSLSSINVELDGNAAEGVISFNGDGRQRLQGTLAADTLDLTPYTSTIRLLASARDWNRQLFDLRSLSGQDLDLRVSAAKVTIGKTRMGRSALGVNLRQGALAISIGEAQIYGGVMRGSFGVTRDGDDAKVKAALQFTDVDLEACFGDLANLRRLSGRGNIAVNLEADGSSAYGLAQSLDGRASLTAQNGALSGFNVEQFLRRLERRPLSGSGDLRSGRTPYDKLNVVVRLNDGIATTEEMKLEGPTVRLSLAGASSIPAREFDLKGVAGLVPPAGASSSFELPFVIQGPWDDPLILPDSESLLRRAPASAPLLDAVRDRRARDAVNAAIERLRSAKGAGPETTGSPATTSPSN